jgi:nickel transport protein
VSRQLSIRCCAAAVALLWLGSASDAEAHFLKVFATATGAEVSIRAYFPPDQPAAGAKVLVFAPDDSVVERLTTDAEGRCTFTARYRMNHRIDVKTADYHGGRFTLKENELPETLPAFTSGAKPTPDSDLVTRDVNQQPIPAGTEPTDDTTELEKAVERAVARQIAPLREQVDELESKYRARDILGAVGFIIGVSGIVALLSARRRARGGP